MRHLITATALAVAASALLAGSALAKSGTVHLTVNGTAESVSSGRQAYARPELSVESPGGRITCPYGLENGNWFSVQDFSNDGPGAQLEAWRASLATCEGTMPTGSEPTVEVLPGSTGSLALLAVTAKGKVTFLFHGSSPKLFLYFESDKIVCEYALKTLKGTTVTNAEPRPFTIAFKPVKLKLIEEGTNPACLKTVTLKVSFASFTEAETGYTWDIQTLP